jgi:argininosuccinate lyase
MKAPPPPKKKSITLHNVAILVHDELVMKSYTHVRSAIVATHYHHLNDANLLALEFYI